MKAVDRMSLTINEGEIRGLVGESGSGKSLVAKAIAGVTKEQLARECRPLAPRAILICWRSRHANAVKLSGREIAMIFQEPSSCLDPSERVGEQLEEAIPSSVIQMAVFLAALPLASEAGDCPAAQSRY